MGELGSKQDAADLKPPAQDSEWYTLTNEPANTAARSLTNSPKRPEAAARSTGSNAKANSNASSKALAKKPFCLVSPNNAQNTTFAGYTGIENFKNSCFMNAVLQVLANTRSVRDFAAQFDTESECERVSKKARTDVKAERLMPSIERERKVAARGELVRELCTIVNELWTGMQPHVTPARFKALFCARFAQFAGNLQQDSHEFLTFLLDGIRDELTNRILPDVAKTASDSASNGAVNPADSSEPTVACDAESAPSNDSTTPNGSMSFLQSFLGELRSEICCLECEHVSTRRDTFFCLSVPIPKPATRVVSTS